MHICLYERGKNCMIWIFLLQQNVKLYGSLKSSTKLAYSVGLIIGRVQIFINYLSSEDLCVD